MRSKARKIIERMEQSQSKASLIENKLQASYHKQKSKPGESLSSEKVYQYWILIYIGIHEWGDNEG